MNSAGEILYDIGKGFGIFLVRQVPAIQKYKQARAVNLRVETLAI